MCEAEMLHVHDFSFLEAISLILLPAIENWPFIYLMCDKHFFIFFDNRKIFLSYLA